MNTQVEAETSVIDVFKAGICTFISVRSYCWFFTTFLNFPYCIGSWAWLLSLF